MSTNSQSYPHQTLSCKTEKHKHLKLNLTDFKKIEDNASQTLENNVIRDDKCFCERGNHFKHSEVSNIETAIFLKRLTGVFETLMAKLEFAATLSIILKDNDALQILSKEDFKKIVVSFSPFNCFIHESIKENSSLKSIECSNCDSHLSTSGSRCIRPDSGISNAVQILNSYEKIRQLAKKYQSEIPPSIVNFLRQIEFIMENIISQVKLTSAEERKKALHHRNLTKEIDQLQQEIDDLTVSLEEQKVSHAAEEKELSQQAIDLMDIWHDINQEFEIHLKEIEKDSEDNIREAVSDFKQRIDELNQNYESFKAQVEDEKANNRKTESVLFGKKIKTESQLASIINKFDTEIVEREEAYEELLEQFKELEQKKNSFVDKMNQQFIIYDMLMKQKEAEEHEIFMEKLINFIMHRSTRVIQRWWREIYYRPKPQKKKKKRRWGKKQT